MSIGIWILTVYIECGILIITQILVWPTVLFSNDLLFIGLNWGLRNFLSTVLSQPLLTN